MIKPGKQDLSSGLVISYFGSSVAVEVDNGQVFQCHLRRNQALPVVGDRVNFQADANNTGTIVNILARRSLLSRGDGHGKSRPIAANLDLIIIVMSPPPIFSEYLIDRYLVAAELLKIQPILVLNKSDLLTDASKTLALQRLQAYGNIPYSTVLSSTYTKDGLLCLRRQIKDRTAVLVGPSGVGKSSIIAALAEHKAIQIAEVSMKGVGKHTTTATRLYHLPEGGRLIDSPGVREFNLWAVEPREILQGFKEFEGLTSCKFRDCQHLSEPNCAVQAAVSDGKISPQRYQSYQKLMKEAALRKKY